MCTIPRKHANINPPHYSFLQLQALFLFIIVRFSLKNIIVLGLHLTHFSSFSLFNNAFLQYFLLPKRIIGFLELALSDFPIRSQSSIDSTSASISPNIDITALSNLSSAVVSGIPSEINCSSFHIAQEHLLRSLC